MLYCGVDIGTTNLKVSLVDGEGSARWTRAIPTPRRSVAELSAADGDVVAAAAENLIIEGWRTVGAGHPLAAIATTGVGEDGEEAEEVGDRRAEVALLLQRGPDRRVAGRRRPGPGQQDGTT